MNENVELELSDETRQALIELYISKHMRSGSREIYDQHLSGIEVEHKSVLEAAGAALLNDAIIQLMEEDILKTGNADYNDLLFWLLSGAGVVTWISCLVWIL